VVIHTPPVPVGTDAIRRWIVVTIGECYTKTPAQYLSDRNTGSKSLYLVERLVTSRFHLKNQIQLEQLVIVSRRINLAPSAS
jgi:hypothetical protein